MALRIESRNEGRHVFLAPVGELDLSNYLLLRDRVNAAFDAGVTDLVVDLSGTEFLDSTALGALITARRRAHATGGSFAVICDRPRLLKLFQITKLDVVFTVYRSLEEWRSKNRFGE